MNNVDALFFAFSNLKRTKFRSLVTIGGVVIGIGCLVLLAALFFGFGNNAIEKIAGTDIFVIQVMMSLFGFISLLVVVLGIFSLLAVSLSERMNEIAIMKAIGASDSDIHKILIYESFLIGLFGGIAGLLAAFLIGTFINYSLNILLTANGQSAQDIFNFSLPIGLTTVLFSVFISLVAGFYPILRALKMNPLKSLHQR